MKLTCKMIVDSARVDCYVHAGSPLLLDRRFRSAFGAGIFVVVKPFSKSLLPGKPHTQILCMLNHTYLKKSTAGSTLVMKLSVIGFTSCSKLPL
jgi:hypothetical protein